MLFGHSETMLFGPSETMFIGPSETMRFGPPARFGTLWDYGARGAGVWVFGRGGAGSHQQIGRRAVTLSRGTGCQARRA